MGSSRTTSFCFDNQRRPSWFFCSITIADQAPPSPAPSSDSSLLTEDWLINVNTFSYLAPIYECKAVCCELQTKGKKGRGANPPDMTQHVLAFVGFSIPLNHYYWAAPLTTFALINRPCHCSFMYVQPIPAKWIGKQTDVKPHEKPTNSEE